MEVKQAKYHPPSLIPVEDVTAWDVFVYHQLVHKEMNLTTESLRFHICRMVNPSLNKAMIENGHYCFNAL